MSRKRPFQRRGAVLPLVVICIVALVGMVALAIDIGMIAIARSQCQNAADSGSMAGARTITGNKDNNYNYDAVPAKALMATSFNKIFNGTVQTDPANITKLGAYAYVSGNVKVEPGAYSYVYDDNDPAKEGFQIRIPRLDATEPYSAVKVTVSSTNDYAFGRIFGLSTFNTSASAVAVHRPRDVIIIMDLSGSMRFQSLPGIPYFGKRTTSMNPDTAYPQFGHYFDTSGAALFGNTSQATGSGEYYDPANISVTTNSGPPILEDFYQNAFGVSPDPGNRAFLRSSNAYDKAPGGLNFIKKTRNTSSTYAATISDIAPTSEGEWESNGYDQYGMTFKDYTEGPGYWGKTFAIWPPDPRGPASSKDPNNTAHHADNGSQDWRQRFFFKYNTSTGKLGWLDQNNVMWQTSSGTNPFIKTPQTTTNVTEIVNGVSATVTYNYRINYAAILKWLKDSPVHFPNQIRAGRIKFYDAIPDSTDTTLNNRWWTTKTLSNLNERFWRDYVDFVLGLEASGTSGGMVTYTAGSSSNPISGQIGNGDYYSWGTFKISEKPYPNLSNSTKSPSGAKINNSAGYSSGNKGPFAITGISSAPTSPALVQIGSNFYTLASSPTPTTTSITLTSGLVTSVANSATVTFLSRVTTGAVNQSGGYASGTTVMSVSGIPSVTGGFTAGDAVRITAEGKQLYYYLAEAPTSTSIKLTGGLITGVADGDAIDFVQVRNMDFADNPRRAKHHFWFGPQTWVDWLGNYNSGNFSWPGNVHEAQSWACKVGIQTAIDDIKTNHPSDFIGMAFFSSPKYSTGGSGQHNKAVVPLGRNYDQLKDSLWFPPSTITGTAKEITPYDSDFDNVPRAKGGTAPGMGFMIAYNLLNNSHDLRFYAQPQPQYRGNAGGLGRKGANRLIIFETDGAPNTRADTNLVPAGADSYYPIRIKYPESLSNASNEFPSSGTYSNSEVYDVVEQICKLETASPPGYSTSRKTAVVYPLGYGSLFDPNNKSTNQTNALSFLQNVAYKGNTAKTTSSSDFPDWQRIYGTNEQRIERMQVAFTTIMQSGVQVSLIE